MSTDLSIGGVAQQQQQQQQQSSPKAVLRFQIGDRVVCPRKPDNPNDAPGHNMEMDPCIGIPGRVADFDSEDCVVVHDNGDRWWYRPEWLEPVFSGNLAAGSAINSPKPEPPAPHKWRFRDFRC